MEIFIKYNWLKIERVAGFKIIFTGLMSFFAVLFSKNVYADQRTLIAGVVPQFEQRKMFRNWLPIFTELEKITDIKFKLVGSPKIPAFEKQFNQGDYDIAYMNPYHVLKAYASQGYMPILRDSQALKGILVVDKNSAIYSVKELDKKVIAFPAPNALGASLLLRSILHRKFGIAFYRRYVQTHSSVYLYVAKNLTDAGGGVNRTLSTQSDQVKKSLRVLFETEDLVSHPIVIHPRVPSSIRDKIHAGFLQLFKSENGKQLLKKVPINNLIATSIKDYKSLEKYNFHRYFVK